MGFLAGDYTPHPNSLLFNAFPAFWPFKAFWFFRKVSHFHSSYDHLRLMSTRLVKSHSSRISPPLLRATPMSRNHASTSASLSTTELDSRSISIPFFPRAEKQKLRADLAQRAIPSDHCIDLDLEGLSAGRHQPWLFNQT